MKILQLILGLFLLGITITNGGAQSTLALSPEIIYKMTKDNNLSLKIQNNEVITKERAVKAGYMEFLPSLSAVASATKNFDLSEIVFMDQKFKMGTDYTANAGLQLSYSLFEGGNRFVKMKLDKTVLEVTEHLAEQTYSDLLKANLHIYYQIQLLNASLDFQKEIIRNSEANLKLVEVKLAEGAATQFDVQRAKAELGATKPALISTQNSMKQVEAVLKASLDLEQGLVFEIRDTLMPNTYLIRQVPGFDSTQAKFGFELEALVNLANEHRNDVKIQQLNTKISKLNTKAVSSSFWPSIVASGTIQQNSQADDFSDLSDAFTKSSSATLSLQYPLFAQGKRFENYRLSKMGERKARLEEKQSQVNMTSQIQNALDLFKETNQKLISSDQSLYEASESYRLAKVSYENGVLTQIDVLNSHLHYVQVKTQWQQSAYEYLTSQVDLLHALGLLVKSELTNGGV